MQRLDAECDLYAYQGELLPSATLDVQQLRAESDFGCTTGSCRVRLWFKQHPEFLPSATLMCVTARAECDFSKTRQNKTSRTGQVIESGFKRVLRLLLILNEPHAVSTALISCHKNTIVRSVIEGITNSI